MAGPLVKTLWDLTTSGVRKCTKGVPPPRYKSPVSTSPLKAVVRLPFADACKPPVSEETPTDFWASCPSTDNPEAQTQQKQLPSAGGNPSSLDGGHDGVQGGQSLRWYPWANRSVRQVHPGSMMANRSIGIRESKGSKPTRKKQLAPADSRVETLPKMAMIKSKVAGRSGGIRGLSTCLLDLSRRRLVKKARTGASGRSKQKDSHAVPVYLSVADPVKAAAHYLVVPGLFTGPLLRP
ncbi:hypothetical protein B0H13DRAFT_2295715 [Mycena leptocephala]|nr:hypothetical protein B0H13DRAFT_2295715 [Mycena leptocephala]